MKLVWVPIVVTVIAALHLGTALFRMSLDDWTLAIAGPIWGCVLLAVWGFWLLSLLLGH